MEVRARGRRQSTNSRLIDGVSRHAIGVLHIGSSSAFQRSTKLPASWDRKAVRKGDHAPELLGWKNFHMISLKSGLPELARLTVSQLVNSLDR